MTRPIYDDSNDILNKAQVQELLGGVSDRYVEMLTGSGRLRCYKVSRRMVRYRKGDVLKFLEVHATMQAA
jgi:excisionase family DNA binding protein